MVGGPSENADAYSHFLSYATVAFTPINFSETVKLVSLAIADIFLSSPPTMIISPTTNCAEKTVAVPVTVVESAAVVTVPAMSADCC